MLRCFFIYKSFWGQEDFFKKPLAELGAVPHKATKKNTRAGVLFCYQVNSYLFRAMEISTATETVAPTMGLLPIPIRPIISTKKTFISVLLSQVFHTFWQGLS